MQIADYKFQIQVKGRGARQKVEEQGRRGRGTKVNQKLQITDFIFSFADSPMEKYL